VVKKQLSVVSCQLSIGSDVTYEFFEVKVDAV
jgi:hypothetical protein